MTDKRFIVETVEITDCKTDKSRIAKVITDTHELCSCEDLYELCDDLNKLAEENEQLQKYNEQLKERLEKINGGYGHLTHRNGLTANEWLIESQERELKKKNEQISDWIERHSKDIAKIGEQKATISQLEEENDDLRFALRTEQAFTRVEKDKKPFLSKEEFLKELEDE